MLKKIITGGFIIIAILSAIFVFKVMTDRSEPKRPDSLMNKDAVSKVENQVSDSADNSDTNTTIEEPVKILPPSEDKKPTKEKPKEPKESTQSDSTKVDTIDENNNIYTNDASSQKSNISEPEEEVKIEQRIDTSLKESLGDIQSKVQSKINNSSSLSGCNIEVSTNDKAIVLNGIVPSPKQKILAGSIANSASENALVVNRITVEVPKPVEAEKPKENEVAPAMSPEKSM